MAESLDRVMMLEQQITHLLDRLQRTVSGPTFSYRLDEIHFTVLQLVECWASYQAREQRPSTPGAEAEGRVDRAIERLRP